MSVRHIKTHEFNKCYKKLPKHVQQSANEQFKLLKENPQHPSLEFCQLSSRRDCWYARVTKGYRTLATKYENVYIWFWIGTHAKFDTLTANPKNLVPNNLPFDPIEGQSLFRSLVPGPSMKDVNPVELDDLIQQAISDFNEDRYAEWD